MITNDIVQNLSPEIVSGVSILASVFALFHLLVGLVMFRWVSTVSRSVTTPHGRTIISLGVVHILFLAAILLLVVFY